MDRSFLLLFLSPLLVFGQPAVAQEKPYIVIENLEYSKSEGLPQLLDLYLPKNKSGEPLPVVVWVHGGGWLNGSKQKPRAEFLAEHGYAVASINYRLTHEAQWPAQIEDCRESIRWLRRNADEFRLNPDKIGVWGSSAGGHLVALMGTLPYEEGETVSSRVRAVCDWYGPTDLLTMPPNNVGNGRTTEDVANSNGAKLLGCTVRDCVDLAKQASAFYHVTSDDAPFLIMHGDLDPGVPISQSTKFFEELKRVGVHAEFEVVPEAGHGGPLFATYEVKDRVLSFFDSFLK